MYGRTKSFAIHGIDAKEVIIEADIKGGLFKFSIVGLPSNTVKESKDRVSAAIKNAGYRFAPNNYTINLAPADLKKEGVALDLPIAMAILTASGQVQSTKMENYAFIGEVSLDGNLRPIKGVLPMAVAAKENNFEGLILPKENAEEAAIIDDLNVFPVTSLNEAINFVEDELKLEPYKVNVDNIFTSDLSNALDMFDVKGQFQVKRALEVAAAGGHNVLMIGPPGSGKTMLAKRLPAILPQMSMNEALETTKIHSVSGLMADNKYGIINNRPFRSPHHTISDVALIGGGSYPKPGEVSLAHNGVLFLDELPEFKKTVLEVLRQPLEDEKVNIARASLSLTYPAKFMMIASMNPCPCGYYGSNSDSHSCTCSIGAIQRYRNKISGPLLDRIDIHVDVPAVDYKELSSLPTGEKSQSIQQRINACRKIQLNRFQKTTIFSNSQMNAKQIRKYCKLDKAGQELLKMAMEKKGFSARAYDRILKVARTIADLDDSELILPNHISEAIQYRNLDKKYWE